jgi:hypothetical protein
MGEARGASKEFQQAVASLIKNRATLVHDDYDAVIKDPGQFSSMDSDDPNNAAVEATLENGTVTESVKNIVEGVYTGKLSDNTKGALLFYSPQSMDPKGSKPGWNFKILKQTLDLKEEGKFYKCAQGNSCWKRPAGY